MGQGFTLRNYTKGEEISSHDLGLGYKLGEFGSFDPDKDFEGSLTQLARELTDKDGRWYMDEVYFVGDYGTFYKVRGRASHSLPTHDDMGELFTENSEGENAPEWKTLPLSYLREWVASRVTDPENLAFRRRLWELHDSPEVQRIAPRNESVVL